MANDETWGAKVSAELNDEIKQLVKESGLSAKEFLEQLISKHKIELLQGDDAHKTEDIQQLDYHQGKIKAAFVALVDKGIDLKEKFNGSLAQESVLHKSIVDQQQIQIKQAQEDRDTAILEKAALEKAMADIASRNEELESNNKTHRITIQMQQEKLDQIEDRSGMVKNLQEEVNQMSQEVLSQSQRVDTLEREVLNHKRELEQAQAAKDAKERESAKALEQVALDHKRELDQAQASKEAQEKVHRLELDRAVLEAEKKIRDEYYSKLEALTEKLYAKEESKTKVKQSAKKATEPQSELAE